MRPSGWAMRSIGRRLRESSPVSRVEKLCPARMPSSRRIPVPELPMSSGPSGAWRPRRPTPWIASIISVPEREKRAGRAGSMLRTIPVSERAPMASTALSVLRVSPAKRKPVISVVPSAMAPSITARWEMDLSPGTETSPRMAPLRPMTSLMLMARDLDGTGAPCPGARREPRRPRLAWRRCSGRSRRRTGAGRS